MSGYYCIVLFILMVLRITTIFACSCAPTPPYIEFCLSDFVILGKPTSVVTSTDGEIKTFDVDVLNKFKVNNKAANVFKTNTIKLDVSNFALMCGTSVNVGEVQLLYGTINNSKATIDRVCSNSNFWKDIPQDVKIGVMFTYKSKCNCKVIKCSGVEDCKKVASQNVCALDTTKKNWDCYTKFSSCKFSPNGACEWASSSQLDSCLAKP